MNLDISSILQDWASSSTKNLRQISDHNGRFILQIRIDQGPFQGILQMYLEGRPDGKEPHGYEFALDYYESLSEKAEKFNSADSFKLDSKDCQELIDESRCIYERYAFLLQLADYKRVIRDTQHNMKIFRFVAKHASNEEDRLSLERWWPYIIRINGTAKAMMAVEKNDHRSAISLIDKTISRIKALAEVDSYEFFSEKERSLVSLDELRVKLKKDCKPSHLEKLKIDLEEAIRRENYEMAAKIRDELNLLPEENSQNK